MPIREIVLYSKNEAALRQESLPIFEVNQHVQALIQDLKDTLENCPNGAGLAAPQINVHERAVAVRLGLHDETEPCAVDITVLVNPEIVEAHDERRDYDGCLSFPGLYGTTRRPHYLKVKARDETGQAIERVFENFDAVLVHHEIDHLNGVLFIDRIEHPADLYTIRRGTDGKLRRIPVSSLLESIVEQQ